jgi:hypothetical protein
MGRAPRQWQIARRPASQYEAPVADDGPWTDGRQDSERAADVTTIPSGRLRGVWLRPWLRRGPAGVAGRPPTETMDLRGLLVGAYDVPDLRIVVPESLLRTCFDLSVVLSDVSIESRRAMLRGLVSAVFAVSVRCESKDAVRPPARRSL